MKFDLFDAMSTMKKNFGNAGEILLTQTNVGIAIRLSVLDKGVFHHREFTISSVEMMTDTYVKVCNLEFDRAVSDVQYRIKNYE